jgi:hypothetical protein
MTQQPRGKRDRGQDQYEVRPPDQQWTPPAGDPQRYTPQQPYAQQAPRKKRKVWPWVLLAIVMIPILGFVACTALVGVGVKAVDDARQGGTVKLGETFTYASGLAITASQPTPYDAGNEFIVDPSKEDAYEVTVSITNGTKDPVSASLITINATVDNAPAQQVFTDNALPTQQIAVGQRLDIPFRFKVGKDASGPLQIAVTDTFNEPVFFTGAL